MKDFRAKRILSMPTSIFATMAELTFKYNAVNLGQGFPDFAGPEIVKLSAWDAIRSDKNQYAPSDGILSLRKIISEIDAKKYNLEWDPISEITITAGATEGLFDSINAFIEKGDEVIIFEPFYDAYDADVILAGGIPKYVTLNKPDFTFDKEELRSQINAKTKVMIINSPHNPTGKVFNLEELEYIAKLAVENDILVLSDEAYEFLTFDGVKHIPIASISGMKNRTITISSTGKTFGMTGWKVGYVCASEHLTQAIRKVHQWTTFCVNTPGQHAMAEGFSQFESYLPEFQKLYQSKKDLAVKLLKETPFQVYEPCGSYFLMIGIPEGMFLNDVDAATKLITENKVTTIPPSCFYKKSDEGSTMLRICFAKQDETLIEGIKRLQIG
jgi:aspartate/methionine/tyrosine aminotransferase